MIWWENQFRVIGNLDELGLDPITGTIYDRFSEYVEAGADNPLYEFDCDWNRFMDDFGTPDEPHYLHV